MDSIQSLIITAAGVTVLLATAVLWLAVHEIRKSYRLFGNVAARYLGRVTKLPLGAVIDVDEGVKARIYAMQGAIHYQLPLALDDDPAVLLTRRSRFLKGLSRWQYSPGRQSLSFHEPVDDVYLFQARDAEWTRTIFSPDIRERMSREGRMLHLHIRRKKMTASTMIWRHTEAEEKILLETVELLNAVARRILGSAPPAPG